MITIIFESAGADTDTTRMTTGIRDTL